MCVSADHILEFRGGGTRGGGAEKAGQKKAGHENDGLEFDGQEFDGQENEGQQRRTNAVENHLEVTYLQRKTTRQQCEQEGWLSPTKRASAAKIN